MLISRAWEHFNQFDELQRIFVAEAPKGIFAEVDSDTGHIFGKVKVPDLDQRMPLLIFDLVNALRSALDHAVFDSARVLGGSPNPRDTKFPFGLTAEEARKNLDRYKATEVPLAMRPFLLSFGPHKGGKNNLWELNQLRNQKIHRILQPMALGSAGVGIRTNFSGTIHIVQDCSRWDDENGVLTFVIIDKRTSPHLFPYVRPMLGISFGPPWYGYKTVEILGDLLKIVDGVVLGIERETARLKVESPS